MAHLFANYDRDYHDLVTDIKEKIQNIRTKRGGERSREVAACERDIQDATEVLETMELGVRSVADANQRKTMESRVHNYKEELEKLTNEMHAAESDYSDREKLFAGATNDLMVTSADHREQVMKTVRGVRSDTDDLKNAAALASATVDVASDTARDLHAQGDKLRSMQDRFSGINDAITSVRKNIGEMSRRNITTKIIIAGIIAMLLGTILLLLYIRFG